MAYLKEDGGLDIERYYNLSTEEFTKEIGELTQSQINEYWNKGPKRESQGGTRAIKVGDNILVDRR